jgi:hypothetical protein
MDHAFQIFTISKTYLFMNKFVVGALLFRGVVLTIYWFKDAIVFWGFVVDSGMQEGEPESGGSRA